MTTGTTRSGRAQRAATYRIQAPRQIEALASPARQEVVDALTLIGPTSIAALAEDLGRAPDSLYYHVRKLERVGLVVRCGTREAGSREEALFDVPGAHMVVDIEPRSARERGHLLKLVTSALRVAERDLFAALESGRAIYRRCARRNAWGARVKGWLNPEELSEVRAHLQAIGDIVLASKRRKGSDLHAVTYVLAPLAPSSRSKRPGASKSKGNA